jgi:hypothetical protein
MKRSRLALLALLAACSSRGGTFGVITDPDGSTADADPSVDAGAPPADAGTPPADVGAPPDDGGAVPVDVGTPVDAGGARACTGDGDCGAVGLVCDRVAQRCVECIADADCGGGRFCPPAHVCAAQVCVPGASTCLGTTRQSTCNGRGSALTESACAAGETCRGSRCQPAACSPGTATCDAATGQRRVCNAEGSGTTLVACASGQRCSDGSCVAQACAPNSRTCVGATSIRTCDATGSSATTTACPPFPHAIGACTANVCGFACEDGFENCNATFSDGCEAALDTAANCGACGVACTGGQSCVGGRCQSVATAPNFRVTALGSGTCTTVLHGDYSGDDRGGIAVSTDSVFYNGDTSTVRASAASLGGATSVGAIQDGIFNDVATGELYALLNAGNAQPLAGGGAFAITQLGRIGATGVLGAARIPLSTPITVSTEGDAGVFAGYGQVVIYSGALPSSSAGTWYAVALPGGAVRTFGAFALPPHQGCENWASWGIAESVGGVISVLVVQDSTSIIRFNPTDQSIGRLSFTNLGDMCSIGFSTARNRWYFHSEQGTQFNGNEEHLGYCTATWSP